MRAKKPRRPSIDQFVWVIPGDGPFGPHLLMVAAGEWQMAEWAKANGRDPAHSFGIGITRRLLPGVYEVSPLMGGPDDSPF